jgi:predicted Fe-Mo cluster-binding NifX family protein
MKVAVSSRGNDLDSQIDSRFGRCAFFLIVERDDMHLQPFDNENIALGGGAGIQSAEFVASTGAKAVITGHCGPNAVHTLSAAGIELFVGQEGTVREAVEKYKRGELRSVTEANVADHHGMGRGGGMSRGGMGRGGGGMGRGRGMS